MLQKGGDYINTNAAGIKATILQLCDALFIWRRFSCLCSMKELILLGHSVLRMGVTEMMMMICRLVRYDLNNISLIMLQNYIACPHYEDGQLVLIIMPNF